MRAADSADGKSIFNYGEDEPLGPGRFMARPRGTTFEYAYSEGIISK